MEIQRLVRGEAITFANSRPVQTAEEETSSQPSGDRLELTRQMVQQMDEQRARLEAILLSGNEQDGKESGGLLGYMETEEDKLDALSEHLDTQMKCMKIAMNIMKGKKVPPEDERYLMEHDPNGYKLAMAMKTMVKEDKKECKSVLDDKDKNGGETSGTEESAPEAAPADGASASGGGDSAEA